MDNQHELEGWVKRGKLELARIARGGGAIPRHRKAYNTYREIINQVDTATSDELGLWPAILLGAAWLWKVRWAALGLAAVSTVALTTANVAIKEGNAVVREAGEVLRALLWAGGAIAAYWLVDKIILKKASGSGSGYGVSQY